MQRKITDPEELQSQADALDTVPVASLISTLDDYALCAAVDLLVHPESPVVCIYGAWYRRRLYPPTPGVELTGVTVLPAEPGTPPAYGTLCTRWFEEAAFTNLLLFIDGYKSKPDSIGTLALPYRYSFGVRSTKGGPVAFAEFGRVGEPATLEERPCGLDSTGTAARRCLLRAIVEYHEGWLVFTTPEGHVPGLSDHGVAAINGVQGLATQVAVERELGKLEADLHADLPPSRSPRKAIISVPISAIGSLLTAGDTADAHRGVWFYDPKLCGHIEPGDTVIFENNGAVLAVGKVTGRVRSTDTERKFCSGINTHGFYWLDDADKAALDEVIAAANKQA